MRLEFATDRKALHYDFISGATDPELGRFLTPDTIIPDWYNPQAFNRYAYVYNNPIIYIDPTGHISIKAEYIEGAAGSLSVKLGAFRASVSIDLVSQHFSLTEPDYISQGIEGEIGISSVSLKGKIGRTATGHPTPMQFDSGGRVISGTGKSGLDMLKGKSLKPEVGIKVDHWENTKFGIGGQAIIGGKIEIDLKDEVRAVIDFFRSFNQDPTPIDFGAPPSGNPSDPQYPNRAEDDDSNTLDDILELFGL